MPGLGRGLARACVCACVCACLLTLPQERSLAPGRAHPDGELHVCAPVALYVRVYEMSVRAFVGAWGVQALCAHRRVCKGSVCTYVCGQGLCAHMHAYVCVGVQKQGLWVCTDVQSPCAQVCVRVCVYRSVSTYVYMRVCRPVHVPVHARV